MLENIKFALKSIWVHKMRSFLTMLGIIIGIASIISIVSTIQGTNEQIKQNLIGAGNNNIDVKLSQGDGDYYMDQGNPEGIASVSQEIKEKIKNIDGVVDSTFYNMREWADNVTYKNKNLENISIYGTDREFLKTKGYIIREGRNFSREDFKRNIKVAIVDEASSKMICNEESPLGKTLEIKGEPFIIIGKIEKADAFEPVINSMKEYHMYYTNTNGIILIPQSIWPVVYRYDEPSNVSVRTENTDMMTQVGKKVEEEMNHLVQTEQNTQEDKRENSISYKAADLLKTVKNLQKVSENTNQQLLWIASISLLVGGIGVMNIMLVSVTERTREIGLKKAIGAKKKKILLQFLTESAVLTSIGGILGVLAGIMMSWGISKVSDMPISISVPASILAVIFSMIIGIVFGFLPSYKAANLNPVDALRHE